MNKKLILKYKVEFDHCLDGGEIAILWRSTDEEWEITTNFPVDDSPVHILINDKYFAFRKALAEGKALEYNTSHDKSYPKWIHLIPENMLDYTPDTLRIRPDGPKFKVGSWVRDISSKVIIQAYEDMIEKNFELWRPRPGEWCWFWDNDTPIIDQLGGCLDNGQFYTIQDRYFCNCEPFRGNLPTALQN